MTGLLLVAYHDLVRYAIPLALLTNVAYIYGEQRTEFVFTSFILFMTSLLSERVFR